MEDKFEKLYYSPDGYWRGETAVNKLADATDSSTTQARQWLQQQPIYQIYLPPPSKITRPKFVEDKPKRCTPGRYFVSTTRQVQA